MTIQSAFDGIVSARHREPGEIVPAGSPVLTVLNRDDRWVRIYISETRIGTVRVGQQVAISSDSYSGKSYQGEIVYIASEAEFTPKTVQTTEERVKLVYAVKVRIIGDPTYDLKTGMPADVRLDSSS
jgi:HlyD family secretion protein